MTRFYLPEEYDRLQAKVTRLEEENAFLKSELGDAIAADRLASVRKTFSLSPQQGRFLLAIYERDGVVTLERLLAQISKPDTVDLNLVKVIACQVRRKAGRELIETIWGVGFRLTEIGRAQVKAALDRSRETV